MITQYVLNKKNQRMGLMVAFKDKENPVIVSWSKCKKTDKFDPQQAMDIALGRIQKNRSPIVPKSMRGNMMGFMNRAEKYFKTNNVVLVG